jgi:hypothetical protein
VPTVPDALSKDLVYRKQAPPAEVVADLQAVEAALPGLAKEVEEDTSTALILLGGGLLGSVMWVIVTKNLDAGVLTWFALPILATGIGFGLRALARANGDTPRMYDLLVRTSRRRELVRTLLTRLRTDLEPQGLVDLTLDQNAGISPSTLVRQEKRGAWDCSVHQAPWLNLQARLLDGTHLRLSAVEHTRKMSKSKLNARGRRKYKYRNQDATVFQVALRVKPETHPGLASLEEAARRAVRLSPDMDLKRLRVAEDRLEMHVRVPAGTLDMSSRTSFTAPAGPPPMPEAARVVTMMLLSLYQTLGYARRQRVRNTNTRVG